jgi:hypothetical protein
MKTEEAAGWATYYAAKQRRRDAAAGCFLLGTYVSHTLLLKITKVSDGLIEFRLSQPEDIIALVTERKIIPSNDYTIEE